MKNRMLLDDYFNKEFEKQINTNMFDYDYKFPYYEVKDYIEKINEIPLIEFIDYIIEKDIKSFAKESVVQYSSLDDATINICRILKQNGDNGFSYVEVGKKLLDDGLIRKEGAYRKYGENHSKTAKELGLVQFDKYKCFLSIYGFIYNELDERNRIKLLQRLILKNELIDTVVCLANDGIVDIADLIGFLSVSTIKRRRNNINKLIRIIFEADIEILDKLYKNIEFKIP